MRTRRRSMLRALALGGAGVLVGLPILEAFSGSRAIAAGAAPKRFFALFAPCGIRMEHWTPKAAGAGYDLPPILAPLGAVQSKVSVVTGLANVPAIPEGPGDHASGTASFLTVAHPKKTEAANVSNGVSLDQVVAQAVGAETLLPSLELGVDGGGSSGNCDSGYSCAYAHNISWASKSQPLPKIVSPSVVWDRLFAGDDPGATAEERARRRLYRTSVLDYVKEDASALGRRLGSSDRARLDQYLTAVSELEKKIQRAASPSCAPGERPPDGLDVEARVEAMIDLVALAFQCDATRVATFMLGNAGSDRVYDFLGVSKGHHEASHHMGLEENLDVLTTIDAWEVGRFARLAEKLDAMIDVDGKTVLDNSILLFGSEIEDGDTHAHTNLPFLVAGSAGGAISTGQHVVVDPSTSAASLYLSLLHALDVPADAFGDATEPLDALG